MLNDIQIRKPDGHSQDTRGIGALLNQHALPSDAIVYGRFDGDFTPRLAVARYTDPAHRPNDVLAKVAMMTQGNFQAVECDSASECLGEPDRIWVIRSGTKSDALAGIGQDRETLLREGYVTEQTWNLTGFTVALLIRKSIPVASGAVPKG